jgi:multimeric flavodoxin WrbA
MIVLNGFKNENLAVESHFKEVFRQEEWVDLRDYKILACQSCSSCGIRTPGQCVLKDDFEILARKLASSNGFVVLTPITFGGYSSTVKYFLDRIMCFCLPLYRTYKGKLLHPMRYQWQYLIGIGIDTSGCANRDVFEKHIAGNALNMQVSYQAYTMTMDEMEQVEISRDTFKNFEEAISCY